MRPFRVAIALLGLSLALPALAGCIDLAASAEARPVKEFHLEAKQADVELYPGKTVRMWTYNGQVPGPLVRATEGDLVRVHFWNNHTLPHTVHFHGSHPYAMDGADHQLVAPGGNFTYEFVAGPVGSYVYHCHVDTPVHIPMGLYGQYVVDPKVPTEPKPDAELFFVFADWNPHHNRTAETYTLNGKAFPSTEIPRVRLGDRVRMTISSLSDFQVAAHLHGYLPTQVWPARHPVDVIPFSHAETKVVEFVATEPGAWMFHDHYESHLTNAGRYPGGSMTAIEVGEGFWGAFRRDMGLEAGTGHAGHAAAPAPRAPTPAGPAERDADDMAPGHGGAASDASGDAVVAMEGFVYATTELRVKAGTTVTWENRDPVLHTVTSDEPGGPLDSGDIAAGERWSFTFREPGEYAYHCVPHSARGADGAWAGMVARVVVTP